MMARDGLRLWGESPRHMVFGVGMDSIQKHWEEWGLFDKGWQPMGHFHSTPIQLLVERGLPALLLWLAIVAIYAWTLLRWLRLRGSSDWPSLGIVLGCLGGLAGFVVSGLVHYNLGDQEVAMVLFLLMGLGLKIASRDAGLPAR
jgi:O-antigen ligase